LIAIFFVSFRIKFVSAEIGDGVWMEKRRLRPEAVLAYSERKKTTVENGLIKKNFKEIQP